MFTFPSIIIINQVLQIRAVKDTLRRTLLKTVSPQFDLAGEGSCLLQPCCDCLAATSSCRVVVSRNADVYSEHQCWLQ